MNCKEAIELAEEAIDKDLPRAVKRRLDLHLSRCEFCRRLFEAERAEHVRWFRIFNDPAAMRSLPPGFADRLVATAHVDRLGFWFRIPRWAKIAACFALLLSGAVYAAAIARPKQVEPVCPPEDPVMDVGKLPCDETLSEEGTQMSIQKTLTAAASAAVLTATALDYPVYTVTTSGDGTNNLSSAQVEVVSEEGATPETVAFSSLALTSGTFRKKGTGFLMSADGMASFTGTVLVEEGAWISTKLGHLGRSASATDRSSVVVSNGASIVFDIPDSETAAFRHNITLGGAGYNGMGAVCVNSPGPNISAGKPLFRNSTWTMTDDATIKQPNRISDKPLCTWYVTLAMNGHTLTFSGFGDVTDSTYNRTYLFNSLFSGTVGHIVLDSARLYYYNYGTSTSEYKAYTFTGSSANTLTVKGGDGNRTRNGSWLYTSNMTHPSPWTLVFDGSGVVSAGSGTWGTTNTIPQAGWAGPVMLASENAFVTAGSTNAYSFPNTISGKGGLQCSRGQQINLINGGNSFKGEVKINTGRDSSHDGELRVFWNGALPKDSAGATLYNSDLTLMYSHDYQLPSLIFDVADGKSEKFAGGTNGVVRSFKKTGAGVLDMTSPLTVTGVTELAGGTLRLPCDRAGLVFGAEFHGDDLTSSVGNIDNVITNCVELGTDLMYTDDLVKWQRLDSTAYNRRRLFTYHGYIWNRTNEPQTWTFAAQIVSGMQIFIDGVQQNWTGVSSWYNFYNDKKVGFMTFSNVSRGWHRLDVRAYATQADSGYGLLANRIGGVDKIENATWQADLGLAIDRQGRGSKNYADYERLVDPGDGSFLTVVPGDAENADGVIAHMPKFDHLKFTGGTLDTRGSNIAVPVLEGVDGAVTNSNAYYPGGSLTVGQKWMLSGYAMENKTLEVTGKLRFAAGAMLDCADLAFLSRNGGHTLAMATGGIDGMPAFDGKASGNKGWHLVKESGNGVESLKLFWRLGTTIVIR